MGNQSELMVVACALYDKDSLKYCTGLQPEMFTNELLRVAYEYCMCAYENKKSINLTSLAICCETKEITQADIFKMLQSAVMGITTSSEMKIYAEAVKDKFREDKIKSCLQYNLGRLTTGNTQNVIEDIEHVIADIDTPEQEGQTFHQIAEEYKSKFFCDRESSEMMLGFPELDSKIGPLEGGDLIIIAARPAVGKSAFSQQILSNLGKRGWKIGYYNCEMTKKQVFIRFISRLSQIEKNTIRYAPAFRADQKERYTKAVNEFDSYNIIEYDGKSKVNEIAKSVRHHNFDVVVIDYLQLLQPERTNSNRAVEVGNITSKLKNIAMVCNIPVIVLSQLNRAKNETDEPDMNDLRESGNIEQDASIILELWNLDEHDTSRKGVKIAKNREGELKRYEFSFDGARQKFEEAGELRSEQHEQSKNPFSA